MRRSRRTSQGSEGAARKAREKFTDAHPELVLNGPAQGGIGNHFDLVREDEGRRAILEPNQVHVAVEVIDFLHDFHGLRKTQMPFVIPDLLKQPAEFTFWVDGGGVGRGFHDFFHSLHQVSLRPLAY